MVKCLAVFACVIMLALASCASDAPAPQSVALARTAPATPGGRMCILQCNKSRDYCEESCGLDYRACYSDAQAAAQRDYDRYATAQYAHHQPIIKVPSDFQHHAACDAAKKSCDGECDTPYNACYKLCGGKVAVPSSCLLCF